MTASAKSILELSQALSGDDSKVFDLCARIGFLADSLAPLEKLQTLGFTPEAILDLHVTCDHDTERMINAIEALE
jgi:hypothetical protein